MTTKSEMLKELIVKYEQYIIDELKSSEKDWNAILYWKLCIIDLRLQVKL